MGVVDRPPDLACPPRDKPAGAYAVIIIYVRKLLVHEGFFTANIEMPKRMKDERPYDIQPTV